MGPGTPGVPGSLRHRSLARGHAASAEWKSEGRAFQGEWRPGPGGRWGRWGQPVSVAGGSVSSSPRLASAPEAFPGAGARGSRFREDLWGGGPELRSLKDCPVWRAMWPQAEPGWGIQRRHQVGLKLGELVRGTHTSCQDAKDGGRG